MAWVWAMMDWIEYHEEPVKLHSGEFTHWMIRGDLLFEHEDLREAVLDVWERVVRFRLNTFMPKGSHGWEIVGVPRGGLVWADALKDRLGDPGELKRPIRIVVDDVYTTGASMGEFAPYSLGLVAVTRTKVAHPSTAWWACIPLPTCRAVKP